MNSGFSKWHFLFNQSVAIHLLRWSRNSGSTMNATAQLCQPSILRTQLNMTFNWFLSRNLFGEMTRWFHSQFPFESVYFVCSLFQRFQSNVVLCVWWMYTVYAVVLYYYHFAIRIVYTINWKFIGTWNNWVKSISVRADVIWVVLHGRDAHKGTQCTMQATQCLQWTSRSVTYLTLPFVSCRGMFVQTVAERTDISTTSLYQWKHQPISQPFNILFMDANTQRSHLWRAHLLFICFAVLLLLLSIFFVNFLRAFVRIVVHTAFPFVMGPCSRGKLNSRKIVVSHHWIENSIEFRWLTIVWNQNTQEFNDTPHNGGGANRKTRKKYSEMEMLQIFTAISLTSYT